MIRENLYFTLGGENSKLYHVINVAPDGSGSGDYTESLLMGNGTIHEAANIKKSKYYYQYQSYEPISIQLTLALEQGYFWDFDTLNKITRWLIGDGQYRELYFGEEPLKTLQVICTSDSSFIHNGLKQGEIVVSFRLREPFARSKELGGDTVYDVSNGNQIIDVKNLGTLECLPNIIIQKIGNGTLSISNLNNGNQTLSFNSATKAQAKLSVNGTTYSGELIRVSDNVYQICTGDEQVLTHQVNNPDGTYSIVNNTKVDLSAISSYATGTLTFQSNGYISDTETITIGNTTYEFVGNAGIYSSNDIPVDISQFITNASSNYIPVDKWHMSAYQIQLEQNTYNFEQGTTEDIMKVKHGLDVNSDTSKYRIINVGLVSEYQTNNYVNRQIFHEMEPIEIVDDTHLIIPNVQYKSTDPKYKAVTGQTAYISGTNNQMINLYSYTSLNERLVGWDNNGYTFYISSNANIDINTTTGMVLEISQGYIYNSSYNPSDSLAGIAYYGVKFYVGVHSITKTTWQNLDVYKIDLIGGSTGNITSAENDDGWAYNDGQAHLYHPLTYISGAGNPPQMLHYTDSYNIPSVEYPTNYSFPCTDISLSKTKQINAVVTGFITRIVQNTSSSSYSLPLLGYDMTETNTIRCGSTIKDTMVSFTKAINANGVFDTDYSQGTTGANTVIAQEVDEQDGYQNCHVAITSKVKGMAGNSIKYTIINKKTNKKTDAYLKNGHDCPASDAVNQLYNAIQQQYLLNPNFDIDINRVKPINKTTNSITVRALIAGSKGNDILIASNTSIASWGNTSNQLNVSLLGGTDPTPVSSIVQAIINTINSNTTEYSASIDTVNPNRIVITYGTAGDIGNVYVSTQAFNLGFDNYILYGGSDELQDGEVIKIDCENETIYSNIENAKRYNCCNKDFTKLVYGLNQLKITGKCYIQFLYQYRYR